MAKEEIVQHNIRLNLENPIERKLHQKLIDVDLNVYKSKNRYIVQKLIRGVFGEIDELSKYEEKFFEQRKDELQLIEERIAQKVISEVLKTVLSMVAHGGIDNTVQMEEEESAEMELDEDIVNAAMGYFED